MQFDISLKNPDSLGWKTEEPAAFQSLKSALIAYFETYQATHSDSSALDFSEFLDCEKFENEKYKSSYFTSITHFQHFFEYVLKAFLESIHPIFAGKMDSKGFVDVYNHLNNLDTSVTAQSIEFSEALDRLLKIKKVNPKDPVISEIDFLLKKSDVLKTLNELRNRIWHKSLFFLRYKNLDLFLGVHILPLARKVMSLSRFSDNKSWLYKKLHCSIDPIDGIINECPKEDCSFERIALLKEMGRSAYLNPLVVVDNQKDFKQNIFFKCIAEQSNKEKKKDALAKTDALCKNRFLTDVFDCPVCGQKTLIKYEFDDYDVENEEIPKPYYIPYKIKCETCSFEIHDNINDLQMCGISDPNFWQAHE